MLSEDAKIEVLHAHYLETYSNIRSALRQRDRFFVYIAAVVTLMLLQVVAPQDTEAAIGRLVSSQLDLSETFSLSVVGTVLWFVLLGLVIRYFQTVIYIDRQYTYIHSLEELLAANYSGAAFTREGKSYLSDYPVFSKWVSTIYTVVFPAALVLVLAIKIATELSHTTAFDWLFVFNALTFIAITVSVVLYLLSLHGKR